MTWHVQSAGNVLTVTFRTIPFDVRDVGYIFEEMWLGKSIISGPADKPALVRWDRSKPLSYSNVVCLTREEANRHDKLPADTDLKAQYGEGEIY